MIPRYHYEKAAEMLKLGHAMRVVRLSRTRCMAYITTSDGRNTLGRVLAETRNRLLDEAPLTLIGRGLWRWDFSSENT